MDQRVLPAVFAVVLTLAGPVAVPRSAAAAARYASVTSVSGTGNLHSWPDAGGANGLAAGDAICQARAAAAGLANPGLYVAWLSSTTTDAYCHLHNLTGKVAANCGQGTLPAAAGPWLLTDGRPWGEDITHLLDPYGEVLLPPRLNENGSTVLLGHFWTGTRYDGTVHANTCTDWTSASGGNSGHAGSTERTASNWTDFYTDACSATDRLICLERTVGDPLPAYANWGKYAFVSSASGQGALGDWVQAGGQTGVAAGDAICRNLAAAAGLPNPTTYKAWLSTATTDARDRFADQGPWMRLDRVRLAPSLTGMTDGTLNTSLNLQENGVYIGNNAIWTGTALDGTAAADRCNEWTSSASGDSGGTGSANAADDSWTNFESLACDFDVAHIYCLEDVPLVFRDGFESGNTDVWSSVVP